MREVFKKIPGLRTVVILIRGMLKKTNSYDYNRINIREIETDQNKKRGRIINLLEYTKTGPKTYSANDFEAGYHKIEIDGEVFSGKRDPKLRLSNVPYDFRGKTVLDIGSNQGGMIFSLQDKFRWAVGVDVDYRLVNASNLIKRELGVKNTDFFVFDIDKDPHSLLCDFLPEDKVDIIFLLAVCRWVEKWQELINFSVSISDNMLFESNGTEEQQSAQCDYLKKHYSKVNLLSEKSNDDPNQKRRRLYLVSNQ